MDDKVASAKTTGVKKRAPKPARAVASLNIARNHASEKAWKQQHQHQCSRRFLSDNDARSTCCVRFGAPVLSQLCRDITQLFLEHQRMAAECGTEGGMDKVVRLWKSVVPERRLEEEHFVQWALLEQSPLARTLMPMVETLHPDGSPYDLIVKQSAKVAFINLDEDADTSLQVSFDWTPQKWVILASPGSGGGILMASIGSLDGVAEVGLSSDNVCMLEIMAGTLVIPVVTPGGSRLTVIKMPMHRK